MNEIAIYLEKHLLMKKNKNKLEIKIIKFKVEA
jgi:hypothetical protein